MAPLKHCWPTMRGRKQTSSLIPVLGGPLLDPYVDPVKNCKISLRFSSFSLLSTCWVFFAIADGVWQLMVQVVARKLSCMIRLGLVTRRPHLPRVRKKKLQSSNMLSLRSFFIQSDGSSPNWTDGAAQKRALLQPKQNSATALCCKTHANFAFLLSGCRCQNLSHEYLSLFQVRSRIVGSSHKVRGRCQRKSLWFWRKPFYSGVSCKIVASISRLSHSSGLYLQSWLSRSGEVSERSAHQLQLS